MPFRRIVFLVSLVSSVAFGKNEILANSAHCADAPKWVSKHRIDAIAEHIQSLLEWDIHRVEVFFYTDPAQFEKMHGLGPSVLAVSKKRENTIHVGPKVNQENFDSVFGHEFVHIIAFQKYKQAIPPWLEEGLANYLAKSGNVDYRWLAKQPFPENIKSLEHPFGGSFDHMKFHYLASQALTEMIQSKCDLRNLLRLSVGTKMDGYLDTYCHIPNLTQAFKAWVSAKSK